jgi:hypothetical protein
MKVIELVLLSECRVLANLNLIHKILSYSVLHFFPSLILLFWKPEKKRTPRYRCEENIKMDLNTFLSGHIEIRDFYLIHG